MADKSHTPMREKKKENESPETAKGVKKEGDKSVDHGEAGVTDGAKANGQNGDFQVEPMEVPPFEIITADRIDPLVFQFQFKNVEYSSGRNKTVLCYLVDKGNTADGLLRGYLEDEHTGTHAEEAFFSQCLPNYDPAFKYTLTWYIHLLNCMTV